MKQFMTNAINNTPTIAVKISDSALTSGVVSDIGGKAVKFDTSGELVLCSTAGEAVLGIVTIDNDVEVHSGDMVSVQIKDNGVVRAGGTFAAGDELATDTNGLFVKAVAGQYVRAIALAAGSENTIVRAMMVNYQKASS